MSDIIWQDFEKNNATIGRGGMSGQYGNMNPELYLIKTEQTCMYENEDQLNDYFRDTLKDRGSDVPIMASELPRETQNNLRSDILNLRYNAARSELEPIHQEIFLGHMDRDERGYHNAGPDLKLFRNQADKRGKFIDFKSDISSDWTIPTGHKSTMRAISDLRKTIGQSKGRMHIFGTERDSRANNFHKIKSNLTSDIPKTITSGSIINLNNSAEPGIRSDNTKIKSDTIKIGYRQIGDHRFDVAQYGLVRSNKKLSDTSIIHDSLTTHKTETSPNEIKNRLYKNIVEEVNKRKDMEHYKLMGEEVFYNSNDTKNKIKQLIGKYDTVQKESIMSSKDFNINYINNNIKKVKIYDPVSHDTVLVDAHIFANISENKNVTLVKRTDNITRRDVISNEGKIIKDDIEVYNYKRIGPQQEILPTIFDNNWEDATHNLSIKNSYNFSKGLSEDMTEQEQKAREGSDAEFNSHKKSGGAIQSIRSTIKTQDGTFSDTMDAQKRNKKIR